MRKKLRTNVFRKDIARSRASFRAPPLFPRGTHERASSRKESFVVYLSISVPAFFGVRKEREYIGGKKNESKNRKGGREGRPSRSALVKISSESASDKTRTHTHTYTTHVHRRSIAVTALGNETIIVRVTLGDDALEPRAVNRTRLSAIDRYRFAPMSGGQVG